MEGCGEGDGWAFVHAMDIEEEVGGMEDRLWGRGDGIGRGGEGRGWIRIIYEITRMELV